MNNASLAADQFSRQSVTSMIVIALLCTMIPFIFLGYYKTKKKDVKLSSFFVGMGFYVLFGLIIEALFHMLLFQIPFLASFLNRSTHPVYYAVYGAIIAGIFQEAGKYIGLKKCMKSRTGKENAFLFGVGHGSFEMIAYGSSLFMGNIIIALMVNAFGIDGYFEKLGTTSENIAEQTALIRELMAVSPLENVIAGTERVLDLVFQVSLTIFIFLAIERDQLKKLFPIAIVLHIIGYVPAYLHQTGVIGAMLNLCLSGAVVVFSAAYAYRMYYQIKTD